MGSISQGVPQPSRERILLDGSPISALADAFSRAVAILFDPFELRRWLKLGAVCLFLGGGATWAAVHWSLGAVPAETGIEGALLQARRILSRHPLLGLTTALAGVTLGVAVIYTRSLSRFALVDTILRRDICLHKVCGELRPLAGTYFRWLLAALLLLGFVLTGGLLIVTPLIQSGNNSIASWILLAAILLIEVSVSMALALAITLTDDLVAPVIYAERLSLPAAWRRLGAAIRTDSGAFALYVLLRFVLSIGIGMAVLLLLIPALVSLFSGAVIVSALVVLGLRWSGFDWVWTPLTAILAAAAAVLLIGLLLAVMALASMPGQVFLQTFGIRFVAPRIPALHALWCKHDARENGQIPH